MTHRKTVMVKGLEWEKKQEVEQLWRREARVFENVMTEGMEKKEKEVGSLTMEGRGPRSKSQWRRVLEESRLVRRWVSVGPVAFVSVCTGIRSRQIAQWH